MRFLLYVSLLVCAVGVSYGPALHNGYVFDDSMVIVNNPDIRGSNLAWLVGWDYFEISRETSYRPIVSATHILDARYGSGFGHALNMSLHFLVGAALVFLARPVVGLRAAAIGALLFLVHPAWSEAIYVIAYREDLLCALFLLVTIMAADREKPVTAGLAYALAVLSKEAAVPLPVWMYLVLRLPSCRRFKSSIPVLLTVDLVYLYVRFSLMTYRVTPPPLEGFWPIFQSSVLSEYVRLVVFPWRLNIDYSGYAADHLFQVGAGIWMALAALCFGYRWIQARSELLAPLAWGVLFLLPVMNIVPILNPIAERYLYIPMLLPCAAAGWGVIHFWDRFLAAGSAKRAAAAAVISICCLLMIRTHIRGYDFHDAKTLYTKHLGLNPKSYLMPFGLGYVATTENQPEEAIRWYERTLEVKPGYYPARVGMGRSLMKLGRKEEAGKQFVQAYLSAPNDPDPTLALAVYLADQGDTEHAILLIQMAKQMSPVAGNINPALLEILRHFRSKTERAP